MTFSKRRPRVGRRVMGRYAPGLSGVGGEVLGRSKVVLDLINGGGVVRACVKARASLGANSSRRTLRREMWRPSGPGVEGWEAVRALVTSSVEMVREMEGAKGGRDERVGASGCLEKILRQNSTVESCSRRGWYLCPAWGWRLFLNS